MFPCLFIVYMGDVVRQANARVLGKGLELPSVNGGRFEINQLLFADDTALLTLQRSICVDWSVSGRAMRKKKVASDCW